MCSGSEAGSYFRLIDFVYHSTLGLRVIKKKKVQDSGLGTHPFLTALRSSEGGSIEMCSGSEAGS